ncbi:MAG: PGF-pre-PGF domain-containing protein [Methanolobus sp.]
MFSAAFLDGEWDLLSTEMTGEDNDFYYFVSTAPELSSFAITSFDPSSVIDAAARSEVSIPLESEEAMLMSTEDSVSGELSSEDQEKNNSPFVFVIVLLVAGVGIMYWALRLE